MRSLLLSITILWYSVIHSQTIDWTRKVNPLDNQINGIAFSADGQKVISGTNCHPASIRIFDVSSGALDWDYTLASQYYCIMGVTFISNYNYIAAIEEFDNIFVFDTTANEPVSVNTINAGTSYAFSTAISPSNGQERKSKPPAFLILVQP